MTPGEIAFEQAEEEWEGKVQATVHRMESLATVMLVRRGVEAAMRKLRVAEHDLKVAVRAVESARADLTSATDTLESAIRLASKEDPCPPSI